jgi:N-acetylglutamate synthase-like GNAT family acetyltransferase
MTTPLKPTLSDGVTGRPAHADAFSVRIFEPADRAGVLALYPPDEVQDNPTAETVATIADLIDRAQAGGHRLWVAVAEGRVIGSIALVRLGPELAHVRAMSVAPGVAERDPVARRLGETAIVDAWDQGYLKLVVHTPQSGAELKGAFHRVSFELSKESWIDGKHMLEFYQNIYERPSTAAGGEQEREVHEAL